MEESFNRLDNLTSVPTLAESEDIESIGGDLDEPEELPPPNVDRYGFSGGQQYTDPNK